MSLSYLWMKSFGGTAYDSEKAQRRLLQMLLAALTVNGRIYIVEKDHQETNYESVRNSIAPNNCPSKKIDCISQEDYKSLLHSVQHSTEKEILKHTLCSAHNLSKRKASRMCG